jgi:hypothetical protein
MSDKKSKSEKEIAMPANPKPKVENAELPDLSYSRDMMSGKGPDGKPVVYSQEPYWLTVESLGDTFVIGDSCRIHEPTDKLFPEETQDAEIVGFEGKRIVLRFGRDMLCSYEPAELKRKFDKIDT